MKIFKQNVLLFLVSIILAIGMVVAGCDAPAGPEGEQGPEGAEGPIGPAGEDGSVMYAGEGEPDTDIGNAGDYYLNQDNGELYGPKDEDGWGNPIIVLMGEDGMDGEDGADGEDGEDGADGEDGSQIYSGEGEPDDELGSEGDYYLDKDSYELYGPKTSSGWGTPLNLKGADGNANVTRYIFPGHDFEEDGSVALEIDNVTEQQFLNSVWHVYLTYTNATNSTRYFIPGYGGTATNTWYRVFEEHSNLIDTAKFNILPEDGSGDDIPQIDIIRIESSETVDMIKQKSGDSIIPDHLDISNYDEVAEYYGFYK